jgi:serine/threonine protein phosphatase 1
MSNTMIKRRLVLGDLHGRYDYLMDVLKKANVDYENDVVIQIGDIVDRGPDPFKCMDELLKIKNVILLAGNHDTAFVQSIYEGYDVLGTNNGTTETYEAWNKLDKEEQYYYLHYFFSKQEFYHISQDNICFVHAGFDREKPFIAQPKNVYVWDRELVQKAMSCKGDTKLKTLENFKDIFIGHTPTIYWDRLDPIYAGGIWNIDTGCGKGGPLTIMDVDTKEYWQSQLDEIDTKKLIAYGILKEDKSSNSKK